MNWERERFLVQSPKTEHHAGKEFRIAPIFPELRPHFDAAFDAAADGDALVFPWLLERRTSTNLRTRFLRIIAKAGIKPWPKLFVNLRSSRATELADDYPSHIATGWLGHTHEVAERHSRQVTDDHFAQATQEATRIPTRALLAGSAACVQTDNSLTKKPLKFRGLQFDATCCKTMNCPHKDSNLEPSD